jgi:thiamine biosynthesis lipoprotein
MADRATELLIGWPSVSVDADGDVSLRLGCGQEWLVDVADPRRSEASDAAPLATLKLRGGESWSSSLGIATSGTSVHRWRLADGHETHHLIDPRTGRSAETDVVQATVVAPSAREAEMLAKTAVILGSQAALGFLTRSAARTAILLLESGELVATPGVEQWLA